jgi:hypothetical protein
VQRAAGSVGDYESAIFLGRAESQPFRVYCCAVPLEGAMASAKRTFAVGLSAPTGLYFPKDETLKINNFPSEVGRINLEFQTHRVQFEGFDNPARVGLWIDVTGEAPSLSDAIATYGNVARGMTAILSVAANTAIEDPTADVAFETTVTADRREYWARNGPGYEIPPGIGRWIRPMLVQTLVEAFATCPDDKRDRFMRSIIQYHHAIQNWAPGSEIAALSHVWVGVEAITKLIRDRRMAELGLTVHQLRQHYAAVLSQEQGRTVTLTGLNDLDGELRKRYIFQGDEATYNFARDASEAYEHSFSPLWEVRDQALQALEKAAGYLRQAILEYAGIHPDAKTDMLNAYYQMPYDSSLRLTIEGELRGTPEDLNAIEGYPDIEWEYQPIQRGVDEEGDALIGYASRVAAANLPGAASFHPAQFGILASPAMAENLGMVSGTNVAAIEGEAIPVPGAPAEELGRQVVGFQIRDLFDQSIRTEGQGLFSFDASSEYRVETVTAPAEGDQESIIRSVEGLRQRRAAEGWELLCALPGSAETGLSLVFRRSAGQQSAETS